MSKGVFNVAMSVWCRMSLLICFMVSLDKGSQHPRHISLLCRRHYWRQYAGRWMVRFWGVLQSLWRRGSEQKLQQSCVCQWRKRLCRRLDQRVQHASLSWYVWFDCVVLLVLHVGLSWLCLYWVAGGITSDSALDGGWSRYGACSRACGGGTYKRTCSNPAPANGGKDCVGDAISACNMQACASTACWCE